MRVRLTRIRSLPDLKNQNEQGDPITGSAGYFVGA